MLVSNLYQDISSTEGNCVKQVDPDLTKMMKAVRQKKWPWKEGWTAMYKKSKESIVIRRRRDLRRDDKASVTRSNGGEWTDEIAHKDFHSFEAYIILY
ncbi:hypothetical protein Tco_0608584 [Tanacetum coccineum]